MTAKGKAGGKLARVARLEEVRAARVEEVRARNWAQLEAAESRLCAADRVAYGDALAVLEHGAESGTEDRMRRACAHLPEDLPVSHPAKVEAEAWAEAVLDVQGGAPMVRPPVGRVGDFVAYFEACAACCDAQAVRLPLSPDVQRLGRWGAALWRFEAALCRELGA